MRITKGYGDTNETILSPRDNGLKRMKLRKIIIFLKPSITHGIIFKYMIHALGCSCFDCKNGYTPVTVSCETCGCLIEKCNAMFVISMNKYHNGSTYPIFYSYYCNVHAPKYDRLFYNDKKLRELEVDDNGEPVGYKKIKK